MIKEFHVIDYKIETDFLPYLQRQTEQNLTYGSGTTISYDFERIEQYIIDRFLTGKPQIDLELKKFEFANEARVTGALNNIKQKIKQEKISEDLKMKISQDLTTPQQINRVKRTLEIAIGFLSATGGSTIQHIPGEEYLIDYVSKTLLLNDISMGTTIEKNIKLNNMVSLWEYLEELFNADPFDKVLPKYRSDPDLYLASDILESKMLMDLDVLLPIMKEMILSYFIEGSGSIGAKIKLKDTLAYCIVEGDTTLGDLEWFKTYFPPFIECAYTLATYKTLSSK